MRRAVRKLWPKAVSVVLVLALMMLAPAPTLAASKVSGIKVKGKLVEVDPTLAKYVATLAKYISFADDGRIVFDAQGALDAGVPEKIVEEVKRDYERYNESIENASFTAAAEVKRESIEDGSVKATAQCYGVTRYVNYGVYWEARFNSCDTNRIVGLMTVGAGLTALAAAVAGILGVSAATTGLLVASALLTIGVGVIIAVSANGCGFGIRKFPYLAPIPFGQC